MALARHAMGLVVFALVYLGVVCLEEAGGSAGTERLRHKGKRSF